MDIQFLNLDTHASISHILGMGGSNKIVNALNEWCETKGGGTRFAEHSNYDIKERYQHFYEQIVIPSKDMDWQIRHELANNTMDGIRPILSVSDLESGIPVSMHEPILTFGPVRELFEEGKISGFGIKLEDLPSYDVWEKLIKNGHVEIDHKLKVGEELVFEWNYDKNDPRPTCDELDSIRQTRDWIMDFMNKTDYDITNYPEKVGTLKSKKKEIKLD